MLKTFVSKGLIGTLHSKFLITEIQMAAFQGLLKLTTPLVISTSLKILCLTKILLTNKKYPPGQKFHLINRHFRTKDSKKSE